MKQIFYLLITLSLLCSFNNCTFSQSKDKVDKKFILSLGMGVNLGANPSYTDYLRSDLPTTTKDSIKTFSTGIEFFGGVEYSFTPTISGKLDYSYFVKGNNYSFSIYVYDFTIISHQPYLMLFYNLRTKNYAFKFGAGAGYHFYKLENNLSESNVLSYKANGFSGRAEVIFAPRLSNKIDAYLSGFVYGSSSSSLKDDNGNLLKSTSTGNEVNLGGYGVGARLGLSFHLN